MEIEVNKEIKKFDALAHAVSKLGPPHQTGRNRYAEASHGFVSDAHLWGLPCGRWLLVDEWSDGDQVTACVSGTARLADIVSVRYFDDGSLCPEYEAQARGLIDAYASAAGVGHAQSEGTL